jgi:hypothetical protein
MLGLTVLMRFSVARAESVELGADERVRGVRGGVALHLLPRLPVQRSLQLLSRQRCLRPTLPAQYTGTTPIHTCSLVGPVRNDFISDPTT